MINQWFPVTLSRPELDAMLIALNELNVYAQHPDTKAALDALLPRLQEAKDRGTVRAFMDELTNATPEDFQL